MMIGIANITSVISPRLIFWDLIYPNSPLSLFMISSSCFRFTVGPFTESGCRLRYGLKKYGSQVNDQTVRQNLARKKQRFHRPSVNGQCPPAGRIINGLFHDRLWICHRFFLKQRHFMVFLGSFKKSRVHRSRAHTGHGDTFFSQLRFAVLWKSSAHRLLMAAKTANPGCGTNADADAI